MTIAQPLHIKQRTSNLMLPLHHAIEQEIDEILPDQRQHLPAAAPLSYAVVVPTPQQVAVNAPLGYAEVVARTQPLSPGMPIRYTNVVARSRLQPAMQS